LCVRARYRHAGTHFESQLDRLQALRLPKRRVLVATSPAPASVDLAATKRGLVKALHSGDPAFDALPAHREQRLWPTFRNLFETAKAARAIRSEIEPGEFLNAAASLCMSASEGNTEQAHRLVATLVNGLRYLVEENASCAV
jgi:hypothetical protein